MGADRADNHRVDRPKWVPAHRWRAPYSRLSRYDETGLIWLLQGREVAALTETTAMINVMLPVAPSWLDGELEILGLFCYAERGSVLRNGNLV
jgi:hypothetical protein